MKEKLKKNRNICCIYVVFFLFICGIAFFIYKDYIGSSRVSPEILYEKAANGDKIVLSSDEIYQENIEVEVTNGKGIALAFAADETDDKAVLVIKLIDKSNEVIGEWNIRKTEFINGYTNFLLDNNQLKKNETYILNISLQEGDQGAFYKADRDTVAYQILGEISDSLFYIFALLLSCTLLLIVGSFVVTIKKYPLVKSFVVVSALLGIIYIFMIPPYFTPDEEYHFAVSYAASSNLLGENATDEEGNVLVRKTDYDYYESFLESGGTKLSRSSYITEMKGILSDNDTELSEQYHIRKLPGKTALAYIPQIIGITLARVLKLNGAMLFLFGRGITYVLYIVLMYWAIKLMPFAKLSMAVVGLLPMTIELATSYNYDAVLLPVCFLTFSYIFYLAYSAEKVKKKDFILLAVMLCVIFIIKSIYAVVFLLALIIPKEKFGSGKKKAAMAMGMIFIGILALGATNIGSMIQNVSGESSQVTTWSGEKNYSIRSIVEDPDHVLGVIFRTFYRNADYYLGSAIGRYLGWLNFGITPIMFSGYIVLLFASTFRTNTNIEMKKNDKMISWAYCLLIVILVYFSLLLSWTRESSKLIEGIQGRYFLPIFPVLMCLIQNKIVVLKRRIDYEVLTGMTFISTFSILEIFQNIL